MTYTYKNKKRCPLKQCEPAVLMCKIKNADSENLPIYVPWSDVELTYAYTIVTTAIDGNGDCVLTLKRDSSSGTTIGTITIATSATVGTLDEISITNRNVRLDYADSGMDAVNVGVNGDSSPSGEFDLYLYFERVDRS